MRCPGLCYRHASLFWGDELVYLGLHRSKLFAQSTLDWVTPKENLNLFLTPSHNINTAQSHPRRSRFLLNLPQLKWPRPDTYTEP